MFDDGATNGGVASRPSSGVDLDLDLYLDAVPDSVPAARHAAVCWAAAVGASGPDLDRVGLAVSEAVTNAVVHAYSGPVNGTAGEVRLTGGSRAGELTILVADRGCGIGRALASPGLGLGLTVMDESCDSLAIRSRPGRGIQLELGFRLRRWAGAGAGPRVTRGPAASAS
jgi:anti-sigma regulatory factor (Ser/Thr protein kinase)